MPISLPKDANRITVIGGVSSVDGITPVTIYVDPITHRVLVDASGGGSGDVVGPASATDLAVAIFNGTTGKIIKNSLITVDANGRFTTPNNTGGVTFLGGSGNATTLKTGTDGTFLFDTGANMNIKFKGGENAGATAWGYTNTSFTYVWQVNTLGTVTQSGVIKGANGTSVAPMYTFTADPSSGMSFDGSNVIISNGGTPVATLLSNGSMTARIKQRVVSMADATSFTPTGDTADLNTQTNTQVAGTLTANAPSGTPLDGQILTLRIKCTNAQTWSWNAIFRGSNDVVLPTSTTGTSKTDYIGFKYNSTDTKWDLMAKSLGY